MPLPLGSLHVQESCHSGGSRFKAVGQELEHCKAHCMPCLLQTGQKLTQQSGCTTDLGVPQTSVEVSMLNCFPRLMTVEVGWW